MDYLISFLEGIVTFISPCLLPMLPVYVSYFAGHDPMPSASAASAPSRARRTSTLINALGFVLGFTLVFMALGAFAGTIGGLLRQYSVAINLITGAIVILIGLNYLEIIRIPMPGLNRQPGLKHTPTGFFSSVLFGFIFSIGWTPCVGAFLGSALTLAAFSGERFKGILMLLSFSLGLGIPFVVSAVLIDQLKSAFTFIKRHYRLVSQLSGGLLVAVGILMMTGLMGRILTFLSF